MNESIRPNKGPSVAGGHLKSATSPDAGGAAYKTGDWLRIEGEPVLVIGTSAVGNASTWIHLITGSAQYACWDQRMLIGNSLFSHHTGLVYQFIDADTAITDAATGFFLPFLEIF